MIPSLPTAQQVRRVKWDNKYELILKLQHTIRCEALVTCHLIVHLKEIVSPRKKAVKFRIVFMFL
jgi:hypothetical protein